MMNLRYPLLFLCLLPAVGKWTNSELACVCCLCCAMNVQNTNPLSSRLCFNQRFCPSAPLLCYVCAFPSISPWHCIVLPRTCPLGHLCMSSRSVGVKGERVAKVTEKKFKCWIKTEKKKWERQRRVQCGLFCMCLTSQTDVSDVLSGDTRVDLHEKGCILPALCGIKGEKYTMGFNFNYTLECCGTPLCNGATRATHYWTVTLLSPLISYLLCYLLWWVDEH